MRLVNTTPIPARCFVGPGDGGSRIGLLVAKATFELRPGEAPRLSLDRVEPIRAADEETELGCLPADTTPRRAGTFEVILLGRAHAPSGRVATRVTVALSIGAVRRELVVSGDRAWSHQGARARPTEPAPLSAVPLIWENAFGGSAQVWLDPERALEIHHPLNRRGRGFDPTPAMRRIPQTLGVAPGYPVTRYVRSLPAIEDPAAAISSWADAPSPACWATVPRDIGLATLAARRDAGEAEHDASDRIYDRAHPDWIIDVPRRAAWVHLRGVDPAGDHVFALPEVRVLADYEIGRRGEARGTVELAPRMLVLQPERALLSILYRKCFTFERMGPADARCLRMRVEEGWGRDATVD